MSIDFTVNKVYCQQKLCRPAARLGTFIPTWKYFFENRPESVAVPKGTTLFHATRYKVAAMALRSPSYFSIDMRHPFNVLLEFYQWTDTADTNGPMYPTQYQRLLANGPPALLFEYEVTQDLDRSIQIEGDGPGTELRLAWGKLGPMDTILEHKRTFILDRAYISRLTVQQEIFPHEMGDYDDTGRYLETNEDRRHDIFSDFRWRWTLLEPKNVLQCYLVMRQALERDGRGRGGKLALTMAAHASEFKFSEAAQNIYTYVYGEPDLPSKEKHWFTEPIIAVDDEGNTKEIHSAALFQMVLTVVFGHAANELPGWPFKPHKAYTGSQITGIAVLPGNAPEQQADIISALDQALARICYESKARGLVTKPSAKKHVLSLPTATRDDKEWEKMYPTFLATVDQLNITLHWVGDEEMVEETQRMKRSREEEAVVTPAPKRARFKGFPTERQ